MTPGKILTKRWCDEVKKKREPIRILICRYRPRGVKTEDETWTIWRADLGPSKELHAAFYGKQGEPITWDEYARRYVEEMKEQDDEITMLAEMVAEGKSITLMCSSACDDPNRCHRRLLKKLIEEKVAAMAPSSPG